MRSRSVYKKKKLTLLIIVKIFLKKKKRYKYLPRLNGINSSIHRLLN
jgi:hypothetical protein